MERPWESDSDSDSDSARGDGLDAKRPPSLRPSFLITLLEDYTDYVADTLGTRYAPYLRHAMMARLTPSSLSHGMLVAECRRYVMTHDQQLPPAPLPRAEAVVRNVARILTISHTMALRCVALAVSANLASVPPASELLRVEDAIGAGTPVRIQPSWTSLATVASREELRALLQETDMATLESAVYATGLHREPIAFPTPVAVYEHDILCGHSDALPVANASASMISGHGLVPEAWSLRLVEPPERAVRSPRTGQRKLRQKGSSLLRAGTK